MQDETYDEVAIVHQLESKFEKVNLHSRLAFAIYIERLLLGFDSQTVKKIFSFFFFSDQFYRKCKNLNFWDSFTRKQTYLNKFLIGEGYKAMATFIGYYHETYSRDLMFWEIFEKADTEEMRITVLYHVISYISNTDREQTMFETERAAVNFYGIHYRSVSNCLQ